MRTGTQRATADEARDGRDGQRSIAAAMKILQHTYVACATCHDRSASHVGDSDQLVCSDCRLAERRRLSVADARRRLATACAATRRRILLACHFLTANTQTTPPCGTLFSKPGTLPANAS